MHTNRYITFFSFFLKSIHFPYVKPKINQIMHGSATFLSNWILCQPHIMHPALYCLTMKYNRLTPFMRKNSYFIPAPLFSRHKGQLISKCLFGVFTFFQKTNENMPTRSKSNLFVRCLEETSA